MSSDKESVKENTFIDETAKASKGKSTKKKVTDNGTARRKAKWSPSDDATLLDVLLRERDEGRQSDSGFKATSFTAAAEALRGSENASGGGLKTSDACYNHYHKLKKEFLVVKGIPTNEVWDKYIAAHKQAKKWKTASFPLYDQFLSLVDGIVATGAAAFHAGQDDPAVDLEQSDGADGRSERSSDDETDSQPTTPIKPKRGQKRRAETPLTDRKPKRRNINTATSRRVNRSSRNGTDAMFSVAGTLESLVEHIIDDSDSGRGHSGITSPQRRSAAIRKLEEDDDLSESEQVAAIRLFSRHTYAADTYLAIKKKATHTRYIQSELDNA